MRETYGPGTLGYVLVGHFGMRHPKALKSCMLGAPIIVIPKASRRALELSITSISILVGHRWVGIGSQASFPCECISTMCVDFDIRLCTEQGPLQLPSSASPNSCPR